MAPHRHPLDPLAQHRRSADQLGLRRDRAPGHVPRGRRIAWNQLEALHVFFRSNPSSHFFYLITITHAVHLLVGIIGIIAALAALQFSRSLSTRQVVVDTTVWYWHVMGALWIFLFLLLEFGQ